MAHLRAVRPVLGREGERRGGRGGEEGGEGEGRERHVS